MSIALQPLPVDDLRETLIQSLQSQNRILISAPTGSGKSTRVPQFLLSGDGSDSGQIIVLQPRRIAARMLAQRVAYEMDTRLGAKVGYQVRHDQAVGPSTRLVYMTEGILLRRLLSDFSLKGVSTVILDEFHERSLMADTSLALLLKTQSELRPDLKIILMSATLDVVNLKPRLEPCAFLEAGGRAYPVETRYVSPRPDKFRGIDYPKTAADLARRWAQEDGEGHLLIFMPGRAEINRTLRELEANNLGRQFKLFPLAGDLPPDKQDEAVSWNEGQKIIVATNVAETSLTIDGVRAVIDSGRAKVSRYDPRRGLNSLLIESISRASADQRAGRAGRTGPGICFRLWSEKEDSGRSAQSDPELRRVDLSEIRLFLLAFDFSSTDHLPWVEEPPVQSWEKAGELLEELGATENGVLSSKGRLMARFPMHPRLSRMLIAADEDFPFPLSDIVLLCAILQGPPLLLPLKDKRLDEERESFLGVSSHSDLIPLLRACHLAAQQNFSMDFCRKWGLHRGNIVTAIDLARQFLDLADQCGLKTKKVKPVDTHFRKILLAGFSDHVAKRLDSGTLRCAMVRGRRGEISHQSSVRDFPFVVAAEVEEVQMRGQVNLRLGLLTAIDPSWLEELDPNGKKVTKEFLISDEQRKAICRESLTWHGLVLAESKDEAASPSDAARLWADEVLAGHVNLKNWNADVERWIARVRFCAEHYPDFGFSIIDEEGKRMIVEQIAYGAESYRDLKDRDVWPALRSWLSPEALGAMDQLAPETIQLPSRSRPFRLDYGVEHSPVLRATVQELYDVPSPLVLGSGKVPITIEILAPNRRPVQITKDLANFWKQSYPEVKKQLKGRYPKHEWR